MSSNISDISSLAMHALYSNPGYTDMAVTLSTNAMLYDSTVSSSTDSTDGDNDVESSSDEDFTWSDVIALQTNDGITSSEEQTLLDSSTTSVYG
jgi:hypothetical protein